jgi:hypothetical protein
MLKGIIAEYLIGPTKFAITKDYLIYRAGQFEQYELYQGAFRPKSLDNARQIVLSIAQSEIDARLREFQRVVRNISQVKRSLGHETKNLRLFKIR